MTLILSFENLINKDPNLTTLELSQDTDLSKNTKHIVLCEDLHIENLARMHLTESAPSKKSEKM